VRVCQGSNDPKVKALLAGATGETSSVARGAMRSSLQHNNHMYRTAQQRRAPVMRNVRPAG